MSKATFSRHRAYSKFAFAALLALTFCMAYPASAAYAKKPKLAKYGSIRILSTPGGLPIEIDGKPEGVTTLDTALSTAIPECIRSSSPYPTEKDGLARSICRLVVSNVWRLTTGLRRHW